MSEPAIIEVLIPGERGPAGMDATSWPIVNVSATTYVLSNSNHQTIVNFTANSPVTIVLNAGLRVDYACQLRQGGNGVATVSEGVGVTVNEPDGLRSTEKKFVRLLLQAMSQDVYDLLGRLA